MRPINSPTHFFWSVTLSKEVTTNHPLLWYSSDVTGAFLVQKFVLILPVQNKYYIC